MSEPGGNTARRQEHGDAISFYESANMIDLEPPSTDEFDRERPERGAFHKGIEHLLEVVPIDQYADRSRVFRRLSAILDPVVHHVGGLKAMKLRLK